MGGPLTLLRSMHSSGFLQIASHGSLLVPLPLHFLKIYASTLTIYSTLTTATTSFLVSFSISVVGMVGEVVEWGGDYAVDGAGGTTLYSECCVSEAGV